MDFEQIGIEVRLLQQNVDQELPTALVNEGFILICHTGSATFEHSGTRHKISSRDIVFAMPKDIYTLSEISTDLSASWIRLSTRAVDQLAKLLPDDTFRLIADHPTYNLSQNIDYESYIGYIKLIDYTLTKGQNPHTEEIVTSLLRALLLMVRNEVEQLFKRESSGPKYRNEVLSAFIELVEANPHHREVAYFAQKLSISPKYLSAIVVGGTGFNAKEFIERAAIEQIKRLLRTTSLTAEQIAKTLDFSGTGNLSRFFKSNTGMTLSDYRRGWADLSM